MTDEQIKHLIESRKDPIYYAKEVLGVEEIEPYQAEVMRSVRDNPKTAFRSAHGVGKTALASWVINWFIDCFPDSKVITTASSWRQVKKMLWPEVHKWRNKADLVKIGEVPTFIEVKTEKGVVSELQKYRIKELNDLGFDAKIMRQ